MALSHPDGPGRDPIEAKRYHGLDLLRSLALLLGVIFHSAMPVLTPEYLGLQPDDLAVDVDPARALGLFVAWSHIWRMPLFFLLAGFFAQMVLTRRGPKAFLKDRAIRVFGVLFVFCIVFAGLSGSSPLDLGHLWFLWFLTWMCIVSVVFWHLPSDLIGRIAHWLTASGPRLALLILPIALTNAFGRNGLSNIVPVTVLDPQFGAFIYFWSFFLIGQALWFGRGLIKDLARVQVYGLLFVSGSILAVSLNGWTSNAIAFQLGAAASTLMLIFGLVGATHALLNRPSRLVRFAARASYPVYIVHVWPAIGITIALLNVGMESTIAVICSTVLAITASLAVYVLLVRYTPLDWLFSGYAKSWFKWPWRPNGWP